MISISDSDFGSFLASSPLYYKILVTQEAYGLGDYMTIKDYVNKAFKFLCPHENEIQTFRTELSGNRLENLAFVLAPGPVEEMPYSFSKKTNKLDLIIHLNGVCQSCQQKIDFLLKASSDKEWQYRSSSFNVFVQKIGQYPSVNIEPDKDTKKYLNQEDKENYKKALTCLSVNFGIAAYAYFRRIIENEIKRIIKDISELEFDGSLDVKKAFTVFENDHQMSKLIDVLNKYLPGSLMQLGDNPLRLLYEQLSGGIHEFSDEQCVEKAKQIDILLRFVIRKINEEKYQLQDVKEAISKLRRK